MIISEYRNINGYRDSYHRATSGKSEERSATADRYEGEVNRSDFSRLAKIAAQAAAQIKGKDSESGEKIARTAMCELENEVHSLNGSSVEREALMDVIERAQGNGSLGNSLASLDVISSLTSGINRPSLIKASQKLQNEMTDGSFAGDFHITLDCGYAGIRDIDDLAKASHCEPIEETIKYNFGVAHNYRETIGKIAMMPEHGRVRVTDFNDRDLSYTERMARIDMEYGLAQLEESECSDDDSGLVGASVEDAASLAGMTAGQYIGGPLGLITYVGSEAAGHVIGHAISHHGHKH